MRTSIALALSFALLLVVSSSSGVYGDNKVPAKKDQDTSPDVPKLEPVIPGANTTTTSTTPASTTSTTTAKTSTTPASTTTPTPPAPTPAPKPTVGKWNLTQENETVLVQMAGQLVISYYNSTEDKNNLTEATITIPSQSNLTWVSGTINATDETIKISWNSSGNGNNSIQFSFHNNNKTYFLKKVDVSVDPADLPKRVPNTVLNLVHKEEHFNTTINKSYKCLRLQTFNLTTEAADPQVPVSHLKVSDLRFEAFKKSKSTDFSDAEDCAFDTPDIVPIAVGCVLAGLVVIVLVVYLISRRRSQARGYVSM
ncbi:hypothetical protein QAD02_016761 [Eretmocerus hayati]|uniref:Uncharacterized protein n=1 Tax=Eretmocerus hayati TaxID=131215 RepID=A0ACC2PEH5_9HYME|nr:hypothetical protein QAD02_016761 [Eretmocerus hayati]